MRKSLKTSVDDYIKQQSHLSVGVINLVSSMTTFVLSTLTLNESLFFVFSMLIIFLPECPSHKWGLHCRHDCMCQNGAKCDSRNGSCSCTPGWQGIFCEKPCDQGYYGDKCLKQCRCLNGGPCDPVTGKQ